MPVGLPLILVALVAVACSPAMEETPSGPTVPAPSNESSVGRTQQSTIAPTQQIALSPTREPALLPQVTPIGDEQLEEEIGDMGFSMQNWKTNFRLRSVWYGEFRGGGPPKDGIAAIDQPQFVSVEEADGWLEDQEPVQVVEINGDVRAYPLQIMIWHEVLNDIVGGEPVLVTY